MVPTQEMREDQKLMRLFNTQREAMTLMMRDYEARIRGSNRVTIDSQSGRITYYRAENVQWDASAELIGIFMTDIERWRWWWVLPGTETIKALRLDAAFAAGKEAGIHTLTSRNPSVLGESDAHLLARLCASLAAAQGVHAESVQDRITFYAVFQQGAGADAGPHGGLVQQYNTVLPPTQTPKPIKLPRPPGLPSLTPLTPLMSMVPGAPPQESAPPSMKLPRPDIQARVPARELVLPIAQHAHALIVQQVPNGFRQAVVVLYTELRAGKMRFSVLVVATDLQGDLIVLDASPDMMQTVQKLLTEDARSGNGPWSRLTIHLTATSTGGVSMDVRIKS